MNIPCVIVVVVSAIGMTTALAQQVDDLQPRVQTSASAGAVPAAASSAEAAPDNVSAVTANAVASRPGATADTAHRQSTTPAQPRAVTAKPSSPKERTAGSKDVAGPKGADSLQLSSTEISGNRELPKLLYVVPWRRDDLGALTGRPPNSLVDEALAPVDREVFERQNRYYAALQSSVASAKSQPDGTGGPAAEAHPKDEK